MGSTIELNHINKAFLQGIEKVNILEDINLEFYAGETIAILGPSGSGKSTLLNILGLLSEPDSGEYFLDGIATDELSRAEISALRLHKIAFVFQTFHLVDYKNVLSNVELPLQYLGVKRAERIERAERVLRELGMEHRLRSSVKTLSGGEKQRVAIARALVSSPRVLLCDEPTGALDVARSRDVIQMLKDVTGTGQTTVIVTHDAWVASQCDRTFRISEGKLVEETESSYSTERQENAGLPVFRTEGTHDTDDAHTATGEATPTESARFADFAPVSWARLSLHEAWDASIHRFRRNLFTILGVALGIASLVLTAGLTATISGQISSAFDVFLAKHITLTQSAQTPLTASEAQEISDSGLTRVRKLNGVKQAAVVREIGGGIAVSTTVTMHSTNPVQTNVLSTTPEIFSVQEQQLIQGRLFDAGHVSRKDHVAVVGESLLKNMGIEFTPGLTLYIDGEPFTVLGVVSENTSLTDTLGAMYVPLGIDLPAQSALATKIMIATESGAAEQVGQEAVVAVNPANPAAFTAGIPPSPEKLKNAVGDSQRIMLIALSSVTLLIGAIGIMNTFLVAVMERRPEIGLRLALGMNPAGIVLQFATEAILSSIIGTFIGIVAAINIIALVSLINNWTPVISAGTIGFGILAGLLVGVVAGLYPAWKASRINPVDTLTG